jgi:hypothetical protein
MFHVGHTGHFDAKVVNNKAECDVMPHVTPQTRHVLTLIEASDGKAFFVDFICKDASLGQAVHALLNFDIYLSVGVNNVSETIFVDNILGKDVQPEAHVFVALHCSVQIEAGKVNAIEQYTGSRNSV